jgi:Pyruvate/2-oxoglutarate dehydrogenase complex, dehydrogenase (E1) component, eukaryotic type, alpha subunit
MADNKDMVKDLYLTMRRIREFETNAMNLFAEGKIPGFVHLYLGEEAVASGVCSNLREDDYITSTHRGHGHIIAKGGDLKFMMAELFGKATGYCKGKGGSMHIADGTRGIIGANGIVGAGQSISTGVGLQILLHKTDQVCVCFFGDGSTNQATFHESLNLAAVWNLPIVFVCENNGYGISNPQTKHQKIKDVADRAVAYGIPGVVCDGNDVFAVRETSAEAIKRAREGKGPTLVECKTYRQRGHFEGDPAIYKPKEEQEAWLKKDPLDKMTKWMTDEGGFSAAEVKAIDDQVKAEVAEAVKFAEDSPYPTPESGVEDVYSDIVEEVRDR